MSASKPGRPGLSIAPEFSGRGSLAQALKGRTPEAGAETLAASDPEWTVLGVDALWQAAAENAARSSGMELSQWLTATIEDAAAAEGIKPAGAWHDAPDGRALKSG
jgi:hypothetical protein